MKSERNESNESPGNENEIIEEMDQSMFDLDDDFDGQKRADGYEGMFKMWE